MSTLLGISIDVTKIDKSKLQKDRYLNITVSVSDESNAYGQNVSAYHEQTKEEREAKENKTYLGNGKVFWTDGNIKVAEKNTDLAPDGNDTAGDLPF